MKVLFDHNVPKRLRQLIPNHDITTAREMGWAELSNGDLLGAAEANSFDIVVTGDKNLSYQQNLTGRALALVVLDANSWKVLRENAERVRDAIDLAEPGSFRVVRFARKPRRSDAR